MEGQKWSDDKLSYELDWEFIEQLAQRMHQNKDKYQPYNWESPININKLKDALCRHFIEIMKDNYKDDDRELGHLEAIALNCMFLNFQLKKFNK